jgi:SAM-dependent methyltransferase
MDNNTVYEWILNTTFTVSERTQDLRCLEPHLSRLVRPDDRVLDLCCGSGPMSFWFEEQGAKTTGVDFAPYMIALAKAEASRRNSAVEFFQADIFTLDFGRECFDLIVCFGNSISDFPLADFARLGRKIASALIPGGRFILDYHDGSYEYMLGVKARQGVYQEFPERITFRYKEYLSEIGANVHTIRNETRGEEYDRKAYLYTMPVIHLALSDPIFT